MQTVKKLTEYQKEVLINRFNHLIESDELILMFRTLSYLQESHLMRLRGEGINEDYTLGTYHIRELLSVPFLEKPDFSNSK